MTTKPTRNEFEDDKDYKRAYDRWWRETNRDHDNELKRNWVRENKEYYSCYFRSVESVVCPCGGHHKPKDKNSHAKTKRHQRYLEHLNAV